MKIDAYHHKNLKNEMIEKGIELVNKYGAQQLSLRKIAQECGVSHAAPYSHFASKEDLIAAIQRHIADQFTQQLKETVSLYKDTPMFLSEFGKAYISFFIRHPSYFHFLFQQDNVKLSFDLETVCDEEYAPFAIYKKQLLALLANSSMEQKKKEDYLIALFAYVHGLASIATMKNISYGEKWEDRLSDLLALFQFEF